MSAFIDARPRNMIRPIVAALAIWVVQAGLDAGRRGLATVRRWNALAGQRRRLAAMEAHQLADIGITADAARREAAKPFWIE